MFVLPLIQTEQNKCKMQNIVNAQRVIDLMVYTFGENSVQTCDGGIVKLTVNDFANDIKFVTDCLVYADVQIRRSGKGIIVLFIPKEDENPRKIELSEAIEKTWHAAENDLFDTYGLTRVCFQCKGNDKWCHIDCAPNDLGKTIVGLCDNKELHNITVGNVPS